MKYSTNPKITPTLSKSESASMSYGWETREIPFTQEALHEMVTQQAYSASSFIDGHKIKDSITEIHNLILDFDKGDPTYEEQLKQMSRWNFCAFIHTTRSHQKEPQFLDKFRIIIPLQDPISRIDLDYLKIRTDITEKFGKNIDQSTFEGNRMYVCAPNALSYCHVVKKTNSPQELQLLDFAQLNVSPQAIKKPGRPATLFKELLPGKTDVMTSSKSKKTFGKASYVTLKNKTQVQVQSLSQKTEIFCPFCDPRNRSNPDSANAFLDINQAGLYYIFCSSESTTFWQENTELNAKKSTLFWSSTVGRPIRVLTQEEADRRLNNAGSRIEIFKNDKDFENYCTQFNIAPNIEKFLPRREVIFDPTIEPGLSDLYFNLFESSDYEQIDFEDSYPIQLTESIIAYLTTYTPTIYSILYNILGEDIYVKHFINWLSTILRSKSRKVATAWLISSKTQGVGKDLVFKKILAPIFGEAQCQLLQGTAIGRRFNGQDQTCWIRGYNEVFAAGDPKENAHRKEWLKNAITDDKQQIELKGKDDYSIKNFMNFILFSNNETAIFLDKEDRRFNVIRNPKAKKIADSQIFKRLKQTGFEELIASEMLDFAKLLYTLDYNELEANTALDTEAKQALIEITADEFELFASALRNGDADYFQLDEVYPVGKQHPSIYNYQSLDGIALSDHAFEVYNNIKNHQYIKGNNFNDIIRKLFPNSTTKQTKKRLRLKKIIDIKETHDNIQTRVYRYQED